MSLGNMEQRTEGMKRQAEELIQQAYNRGYKEGYSKAENDYHAKTEDDRQSSYELGLNMAWEAFKTIHKLAPYCFLDCFPNGNDELYSLSINEVIRRVHEYEKKQEEDEEIKVGDEVTFVGGIIGIVTHISEIEGFSILWKDGSAGKRKNISDFKKTGRHFPEVAVLMEKMKEGEE